MAFPLTNPLRSLLAYMRGDDIRDANARVLARNRADQASGTAAARPAPVEAPAAPPAAPGRHL